MNQISALPNPLKILFQEYNQGQIESVGFRSFKEILEAIRLMDADERRGLTRALFAYLLFFLCKGKQAVQTLRRKAPDSGKCANGVQKVCSRFLT